MSSSLGQNSSAEQLTSQSKNILAQTIEDKDIYKTVVDTRNFEISLFWQRSNYFLALNSALAVGFFSLKTTGYDFVLAAFGFIVSVLWLRVAVGSKYWQSRWEHRLKLIEQRVAPNLGLFSADWETIDKDVKDSLENHPRQSWLKTWLESLVVKKQSVSYNMMLLSLLFILGWIVLAITRLLSSGLMPSG